MNNCLDWIASRKHLTRTPVASAGDGGCACRIQRVRFVDVFLFARAAVPAGSLRSMFVSNVSSARLSVQDSSSAAMGACLAWCARSNYHEEVDLFFLALRVLCGYLL